MNLRYGNILIKVAAAALAVAAIWFTVNDIHGQDILFFWEAW